MLVARGRGRGVEGEHRVADDGGALHVHRPSVARLHEQRVGVSLFGVVVRAVAVAVVAAAAAVVVAVVAGDRRSAAACARRKEERKLTEKSKNKKTDATSRRRGNIAIQYRRRQRSGYRAYLDSGYGGDDGGGGDVSEVVALARRRRRPRSTASCAAAPVVYSRRAFPGSGRSVSEVCKEQKKKDLVHKHKRTLRSIAVSRGFRVLREKLSKLRHPRNLKILLSVCSSRVGKVSAVVDEVCTVAKTSSRSINNNFYTKACCSFEKCIHSRWILKREREREVRNIQNYNTLNAE